MKKLKQILLDYKNDSLTLEEIESKIIDLCNSLNTKAEYSNGRNAGEVAKEHKTAVGKLGCPHCGIVTIGAIFSNECTLCGKPYLEPTFNISEEYKPSDNRYVLGFNELFDLPFIVRFEKEENHWKDSRNIIYRVNEWCELTKNK